MFLRRIRILHEEGRTPSFWDDVRFESSAAQRGMGALRADVPEGSQRREGTTDNHVIQDFYPQQLAGTD